MKKIKCIIVEDELEARNGLSFLLQKKDEIEVMALCKNGIEAITAINEIKPDLLFLDIQMPEINGFEVLRSVEYTPKAIVFVTAYDQFALQAFEVQAVDYLLKPYTEDRLHKSIALALTRFPMQVAQIEQLSLEYKKETVVQSTAIPINENKIALKSNGIVHLTPISSIVWVEADDYYIKVHTVGQSLMIRSSLKKMEGLLPSKAFVRVHKSSIVNINCIQSIEKIDNGQQLIHLNNKEKIVVSRGYKSNLKGILR